MKKMTNTLVLSAALALVSCSGTIEQHGQQSKLQQYSSQPASLRWHEKYFNLEQDKSFNRDSLQGTENDFQSDYRTLGFSKNWGYGSPQQLQGRLDYFAAVFSTMLPVGYKYKISISSDDGIRIVLPQNYLNNQEEIIANWNVGGNNTLSKDVEVRDFERELRVEYFEWEGEAKIDVQVQVVGVLNSNPIPNPGYQINFVDALNISRGGCNLNYYSPITDAGLYQRMMKDFYRPISDEFYYSSNGINYQMQWAASWNNPYEQRLYYILRPESNGGSWPQIYEIQFWNIHPEMYCLRNGNDGGNINPIPIPNPNPNPNPVENQGSDSTTLDCYDKISDYETQCSVKPDVRLNRKIKLKLRSGVIKYITVAWEDEDGSGNKGSSRGKIKLKKNGSGVAEVEGDVKEEDKGLSFGKGIDFPGGNDDFLQIEMTKGNSDEVIDVKWVKVTYRDPIN